MENLTFIYEDLLNEVSKTAAIAKRKKEIENFKLDLEKYCHKWIIPSMRTFLSIIEEELCGVKIDYLCYDLPFLIKAATDLANLAKNKGDFGPTEKLFFEIILNDLLKTSLNYSSGCFESISAVIHLNRYKCKKVNNIFENYNLLYEIISKIIDDWDRLEKCGYCSSDFASYRQYIINEESRGIKKDAQEKKELFIKLLDGKLFLAPVYKKVPVGYTLVDNPMSHEIIITDNSGNLKFHAFDGILY